MVVYINTWQFLRHTADGQMDGRTGRISLQFSLIRAFGLIGSISSFSYC